MHLDILSTSAFYLDPFRPLILAIIKAEGGQAAYVRAIQCSRPAVTTFAEALAVGCKTIRGRVLEFQVRDKGPLFSVIHSESRDPWTQEAAPRRLALSQAFVTYLAGSWAPVGASNDPTHLNENWAGNVWRFYLDMLRGERKEAVA